MDWNLRSVISYATESFRNFIKLTPKNSLTVNVKSYEPYNVQDMFQIDKDIPYIKGDLDYVRAVVTVFKEKGYSIPGMDVDIKTTIPVGTGLSSSAALCVSTAFAVSEAFSLGFNPSDVAEIAYTAERKRLGINCGQMDPYTSAHGGLCYIDCSTEPPKRIEKLSLEERLPIIVGDTLISRRAGRVLAWLGTRVKDEDPAMLEGVKRISSLVDEAWAHLKSEKFSLELIGQYMNENQRLLREYLRVSTFEIEELIYTALKAGALGAKLIGAGGGGCIMALCNQEEQSRIVESIDSMGGKTYLTDLSIEGVRREKPESFEVVKYPVQEEPRP